MADIREEMEIANERATLQQKEREKADLTNKELERRL
jgi:hypothetical protein